MYEEYLRDPNSVGQEWRELFENGKLAEVPIIPEAPGARSAVSGTRETLAVPAPEPPARRAPLTAHSVPPNAVPITGPAARLVANMTESLTVPTATSSRDISAATLDTRRKALNAQLAASGKKISFTHLIGYAIVQAAKRFPEMPDDFAGGTIQLTNPGTLGTVASVPRLMKGQGSILATGAIREIAGTKIITITSTYDHRIIQGAESGMFLRTLDSLLQGEERFYEGGTESIEKKGTAGWREGRSDGSAPGASAPRTSARPVRPRRPPTHHSPAA